MYLRPRLRLEVGEVAGQTGSLFQQGIGRGQMSGTDEVTCALAETNQKRVACFELRLDRPDLGDERTELLGLALATQGHDGLSRSAKPHRRTGHKQAQRLRAGSLGLCNLAAPAMRLGLDQTQRPAHLARLRVGIAAAERGQPEGHTGNRTREIVRLQGLLGRAPVPEGRAAGVASPTEMLCQHDGLGRAVFQQPLGGQVMAQQPVFLGQHRVGRLANQGVGEREGRAAVGGDRRHRQVDELAIGEPLQRFANRRALAAEQRRHPIAREGFAKHRGRTQHPPTFRALGLQPRLDDAEDRLGHLAGATRVRRTHQFFQEKRIAVATLDNLGHRLVRDLGAESLAHQALAGPTRERR